MRSPFWRVLVWGLMLTPTAGDECSAAPQPAPVAVVLGNPILPTEIHPDADDRTALRDYFAIAGLIVQPLCKRYIREHRLEATPDEIRSFRQSALSPKKEPSDAASQARDAAEDEKTLDAIAKFFIERWKLNKSLYRRYGGRVVFQQLGPEPLDAYRDWLKAEEKAGNFKIYDPKWSDAFWEYYQPKYHVFDDERDPFRDPFGVPPW